MMKKLIIVVGVSGSGKTSFAKYYARKHNGLYIDFDLLFNFDKPDYQEFLNKLSDLIRSSKKQVFVLDGYMSEQSPSIPSLKTKLGADIKLCLCFASPQIIEERQIRKVSANEIKEYLAEKDIKQYTQDLFLTIVHQDPSPILIDTGTNNIFQTVPKEGWVQRWKELTFISELSQKNYDKYYQTIELPSGTVIKGYSGSEKTWEKLRSAIDFENKTVLDIGSFHGFFCFKIEEVGAKRITGIEKSKQAVLTARQLSWLKNSKALFLNKEVEKFKPKGNYDIVLALNMLHHVGDLDAALNKIFIFGKLIVFEIPVEQEKLVLEYAGKYNFTIFAKMNSHRLEREILILKNKSATDMQLKKELVHYSYSSQIYRLQKLIKNIKSIIKRVVPRSIMEIYRKRKISCFKK